MTVHFFLYQVSQILHVGEGVMESSYSCDQLLREGCDLQACSLPLVVEPQHRIVDVENARCTIRSWSHVNVSV